MTNANTILEQLQTGFTEIFQIEAPTPDTDLIGEGILDSFQLVELLAFLDKRFGLTLELEDVDLEDLRTLERLARLVTGERAHH